MEWILIIAVVIIGLMVFADRQTIEGLDQRITELEEKKDVDHRPEPSL